MALPVPAAGTALGEPGDAYVASLSVEILVDGRVATTLGGDDFEALVSATRLRHLAFHPRTRSFLAGRMDAAKLAAAIERHWASLEASAESPTFLEAVDTIATMARSADFVAWAQAN